MFQSVDKSIFSMLVIDVKGFGFVFLCESQVFVLDR